MRPGRPPGCADIADDLTLPDARTLVDSAAEFLHVRVSGLEGPVVTDADVIAVAAVALRHFADAVARRIDRGTSRRRKIESLMHLSVAQIGSASCRIRVRTAVVNSVGPGS